MKMNKLLCLVHAIYIVVRLVLIMLGNFYGRLALIGRLSLILGWGMVV